MQRFSSAFSFINKPTIFGRLKKMYNNQQMASITSINLNTQPLPKQPVPDLVKTIEKYLISIQPLLKVDEFKKTEKLAREFLKEDGIARQLYSKLQERYEKKENWMSEWWLREAYLGYRYPVIVHSSPGTVGPLQKFDKPDDFYRFAARLIGGVCNYNEMIKSCNIKQEFARDIPLDMQPYAMILGTHRQPDRGVDNLLHIDDSEHIIVISNNHFFKIKIGNTVNEESLMGTIKDIVARSQSPGKPVGILTGNDRDIWAEVHEKLRCISANIPVLKDIETALFVFCLDKALPKELFVNKNNESVRAVQSLTGCSSSINASNRWHDKTVQFILSDDGFIGMQYEHSPCEGLPISVLTDYVINYIKSKENEKTIACNNFAKAEHLEFTIDSALECSIKSAIHSVDKLSNDIDMECFTFKDFGSNEIKKCKLSPDSFIQIAMQLTYFKIHQKPPAHYESAALRRFKNARTECIRTTCNESVNFAKLMANNDENGSIKEKKEAMLKAINAHKNIANAAASGEGVDRLLFGLKMIAKEEKINLPELYNDIGYRKSTYFNLTSSQVAYKTASFMCYGPVVPDGYGCCYNPRPNDILFACSSFKECSETNTQKFAEMLKKSLSSMKKIADA